MQNTQFFFLNKNEVKKMPLSTPPTVTGPGQPSLGELKLIEGERTNSGSVRREVERLIPGVKDDPRYISIVKACVGEIDRTA